MASTRIRAGFAVSFLVSYMFVYLGPSRAAAGSRDRPGDQHGQRWTVILNPEKRKVGGSTPPLTTHSWERVKALSPA